MVATVGGGADDHVMVIPYRTSDYCRWASSQVASGEKAVMCSSQKSFQQLTDSLKFE